MKILPGAKIKPIEGRGGFDERPEKGPQKGGEPPPEDVEVEACGGEDGVDAVAVTTLEIVAVHPVVGLDAADDRGNSHGPPFAQVSAASMRELGGSERLTRSRIVARLIG